MSFHNISNVIVDWRCGSNVQFERAIISKPKQKWFMLVIPADHDWENYGNSYNTWTIQKYSSLSDIMEANIHSRDDIQKLGFRSCGHTYRALCAAVQCLEPTPMAKITLAWLGSMTGGSWLVITFCFRWSRYRQMWRWRSLVRRNLHQISWHFPDSWFRTLKWTGFVCQTSKWRWIFNSKWMIRRCWRTDRPIGTFICSTRNIWAQMFHPVWCRRRDKWRKMSRYIHWEVSINWGWISHLWPCNRGQWRTRRGLTGGVYPPVCCYSTNNGGRHLHLIQVWVLEEAFSTCTMLGVRLQGLLKKVDNLGIRQLPLCSAQLKKDTRNQNK